MTILNCYCKKCKTRTPHNEGTVFDLESATVWYCLCCGEEFRPGGGNTPVLASPPGGRPDGGTDSIDLTGGANDYCI